jgi:hypothetical protein
MATSHVFYGWKFMNLIICQTLPRNRSSDPIPCFLSNVLTKIILNNGLLLKMNRIIVYPSQ